MVKKNPTQSRKKQNKGNDDKLMIIINLKDDKDNSNVYRMEIKV